MFVFLTWSFVRGGPDYLKGEGTSRVSMARGRRNSQAHCFSVLKGLEVPLLLNFMRLSIGTKGLLGFFDTWWGVTPLASPRGAVDYDGS